MQMIYNNSAINLIKTGLNIGNVLKLSFVSRMDNISKKVFIITYTLLNGKIVTKTRVPANLH